MAVRTYLQAEPSQQSCDGLNSSCPPAWCVSTATLLSEISTEAVAGQTASAAIGLAPGSRLSLLGSPLPYAGSITFGPNTADPYVPQPLPLQPNASAPTLGAVEGAPVQVQALRVAPEAASVRLTTPDGTDTAAPTNGLVTLVVPGAATSGDVVALDAGGHQLATLALPAQATAFGPQCGPQLPKPPIPGAQPTDRAAAEQAIHAAFDTAFTHPPAGQPYHALTAVEGGDALRGTLDALNRNFPQAVATAEVTSEQVVFVDPTNAVARFTLTYSGGAPYGTRNGTAVLHNGKWLVSRDTYCRVIAFGDAQCPAS